MIDLAATNEWQYVDKRCGLVFPWYVKSFLDVLVKWDIKSKNVLEFGCGASTVWWAWYAKSVISVDNNLEWIVAVKDFIKKFGLINSLTIYEPVFEGEDSLESAYVHVVDKFQRIFQRGLGDDQWKFDIAIVDGMYRDECVFAALGCIKPGGVLIIDNWMQPSVWVAEEETQNILSTYESEIYKQEGHPDWQTAVFYIK